MDPVAELTVAELTAAARHLWGGAFDATLPGVLQPAAVWRDADGRLRAIRINEHAPQSGDDALVLGLCRARADAVVTSGRILREEPGLRHELGAGLTAWRREVLGKTAPPFSVVLSSGRGLDLDHPVLRRPVIYTTPEGRGRLAEAAARRGLEVVSDTDADLRRALAYLRRRLGTAATITVENGPSSSAALYEPPVAVDEVLLTIFEEAELDERARGEPWPAFERLPEFFARPHPPVRLRSVSGNWRFERFRRRHGVHVSA